MPNASDEFLDRSIMHAHFIERVKTQQAREALQFLNKQVLPDISKKIISGLSALKAGGPNTRAPESLKRLQRMYADTFDIFKEGMRTINNEIVTPNLAELGLSETQWTSRTLAQSVPVDIVFGTTNLKTINHIIKQRPYQGATLNKWWSQMTVQAQNELKAAVNTGIIQGESVRAISRRVAGSASGQAGVYGNLRNKINTQVRTAINHTVTQTREETYKENRKLIKKVQWVSTLDNKTSFTCISLDGKVFPIDRGQRPPAHFNCRSTTTPVLESFKRFGLKDPPPSTRASLNGQVSEKLKYPDWFKKQPASLQKEVLGPARYKLWKSGKVDVDKFVDRRNAPLTVRQLEAREKRKKDK